MSTRGWRALLALVGLGYAVKVGVPLLLQHRASVDFLSYYLAARACHASTNMYDIETLREVARHLYIQAHVFPYLYPPPFACVLTPLARLPFWIALRAWGLLMLAATVGVLYATRAWLQRLHGHLHPGTTLALALLIVLLPFDVDLMTGQVNILVLLLVVVALYLDVAEDRSLLGGIALGTAILIKVTPVLLLPYFLFRKRWRFLLGSVAGLVVESGVSLLVTPSQWMYFGAYWQTLGSPKGVTGLFPLTATSNMSPAGLWALLLGGEAAARVAAGLTTAALWGGAIVAQARRGEKRAPAVLLPYLVAMILSAPYVYIHHVVYLYPGVAWWVVHLLREERAGRAPWAVLGLTALASINITLYSDVFFLRSLPPLAWRLGLFALLALFLVGLVARPTSLSEETSQT